MKILERQGAVNVPYTHMYPLVTSGVCEFCGVIDKEANVPQYRLCQHFKDMPPLQCSYCDASKNPEDVVYHSIMKVHESPYNPNELIVVCNQTACETAHEKRFKRSN